MRGFYPISLFFFLVSMTVFASELPNELTRYTSNNGSRAVRKVFLCRVFANRVTKQTTEGSVTGSPVISDVAWTSEVANADVLARLVDRAAEGLVTYGPRRIGAGVQLYEGVQTVGSGAPKAIVLRATGGMTAKNSSSSAATLVDFTQFNCLQQ